MSNITGHEKFRNFLDALPADTRRKLSFHDLRHISKNSHHLRSNSAVDVEKRDMCVILGKIVKLEDEHAAHVLKTVDHRMTPERMREWAPEKIVAMYEARRLSEANTSNERLEELQDKIDGLEADLESAVEVAWKRGAKDWVILNYPKLAQKFTINSGEECLEANASAGDCVITSQDIYYLESIYRNLEEFAGLLDLNTGLSLGGQVLYDNKNYLDCFIDQHKRKLPERKPAEASASRPNNQPNKGDIDV